MVIAMKALAKIFIFLTFAISVSVKAQEIVSIPYQEQGVSKNFEAVLTKPKTSGNGKAVVILHHSGGWGAGTTKQYAEFLASHGFTTLEPRMFNVHTVRAAPYLPQAFAALGYLGSLEGIDKNQISVMGLSLGGMMSVFVASKWVNNEYNKTGLTFAKYAPFYPTCWLHAAAMNRKLPFMLSMAYKFDPAAMDTFVGKPMKIFAGDIDDNDDRDPDICNFMVSSMKDDVQRSMTEVVVYKNATHGWDQESNTFMDRIVGCKGKGCRITLQSNPEVTRQALLDLLEFLGR